MKKTKKGSFTCYACDKTERGSWECSRRRKSSFKQLSCGWGILERSDLRGYRRNCFFLKRGVESLPDIGILRRRKWLLHCKCTQVPRRFQRGSPLQRQPTWRKAASSDGVEIKKRFLGCHERHCAAMVSESTVLWTIAELLIWFRCSCEGSVGKNYLLAFARTILVQNYVYAALSLGQFWFYDRRPKIRRLEDSGDVPFERELGHCWEARRRVHVLSSSKSTATS